MARPIVYIGDQNPIITATLYDGAGNPLDINPATHTVKFGCRLEFDPSNAFGPTTGQINQSGTGGGAINTGQVQYVLGSSDLATVVPGIYFTQWIVFDVSNHPMHVEAGQIEVRKAL